METALDIEHGELYLFPERSRTTVFELHGSDGANRLIFVSKSDTTTLRLGLEEFSELRNRPNGAIRVPKPDRKLSESYVYTDPATFIDPTASSLSVRERARILALKKSHLWALSVQFYTRKYDEAPETSRSDDGLDQFIASHSQEAQSIGLLPLISASTLRKAIKERGTSGDRELHYFLPDRERHRGKFWDPFILQLRTELVDGFWHPSARRLGEVLDEFLDRLRKKNDELQGLGAEPLKPPTREILRLWINREECYFRYKARYGKKLADRRFRGHMRALQATRPLEYVMFDHALADAWAPYEDEDGCALLPERPWLVLAVDVFSRVILAAVLTFASPSVHTVAMALSQLIRPKTFLSKDLLRFKNFGDFYGRPSFIIVDRAWENTGTSFQTICESVGINIIWAPVRTPQFKCHVEHAFHDLNQRYWHRLPSGIPHKPHTMSQLGLDPRARVDRGLKEMTDGLWYAIRKLAFTVNEGIGMAPARAWLEGFRQHRRPTIDDVGVFDSFLGKVRECQLSTRGIRLENNLFHDPETTSALLNDLLRFAKKSMQRRAALSSGTVRVHVTMSHTCDSIEVWNPLRRKNVKLPNILPRYSSDLTWEEDKAVRAFARQRNLAFCTEDEMLDVSLTVASAVKSKIQQAPFREARKVARKHRPKATLVPGNIIEEVWEEPSDSGMGSRSVKQFIPATRRTDERRIAKITRRGGAAATKKAVKTRRLRQDAKKLAVTKGALAEAPTAMAPGDTSYADWAPIVDSAGHIAALVATQEKSSC
jgi:putative transposase